MRMRRCVAIVVSMACGVGGSSCQTPRPAGDRPAPRAAVSSRRMADGNDWTTENLSVAISGSYCYADVDRNCRRYGRLYTWESARRGCQSLGSRWRLPTDDEWRELARRYDGVGDESADDGRSSYRALMFGGRAGFNARLGGGRTDGLYARLEAHGFYWTDSGADSAGATFYNFAHGGRALHRQASGEKLQAFSVRCIRRPA